MRKGAAARGRGPLDDPGDVGEPVVVGGEDPAGGVELDLGSSRESASALVLQPGEAVSIEEPVIGEVVFARIGGSKWHPAIVLEEHPNDVRDVVVLHSPAVGGSGQCFSFRGRMRRVRSESQSIGWKPRRDPLHMIAAEPVEPLSAVP